MSLELPDELPSRGKRGKMRCFSIEARSLKLLPAEDSSIGGAIPAFFVLEHRGQEIRREKGMSYSQPSSYEL